MSRIEIRLFRPDDLPEILTLLVQPDMDDGRVLSEPEANSGLEQIEAAPNQQVYVAESVLGRRGLAYP